MATRMSDLSNREAAAAVATSRMDSDRLEIQAAREEIMREAAQLEERSAAVRQGEDALRAAQVHAAEERAAMDRARQEAADELARAEADAAAAQRLAAAAERKAADAELAARAAYDRALAEDRRVREVQVLCLEEARRLDGLKEDFAATERRVEELRAECRSLEAVRKSVAEAQAEVDAERAALRQEHAALDDKLK